MNRAECVAMVDRCRTDLSVRRQYALLGLARSGFYRQPAAADPEGLALMRCLDEQYLATPFYGSRRMTAELRKAGRRVNNKRWAPSPRPAAPQPSTGSTPTCCVA
jgi:putative transposase